MKFTLVPKTIGRMVCFATIWLSFTSFCSAQGYHQLTNDDFRGNIGNISMGVIANTNCTIDFKYVAHQQNGYYRLDFDIRLVLNNNKSWIDRRRVTSAEMLNQILKHEQGHYTVAFMEQQELIRTVSRTVFHEDYQSEARRIFNRIDAKYKQLNLDYDAATRHMLNREQQQSWDAYFEKQLEFMPPG